MNIKRMSKKRAKAPEQTLIMILQATAQAMEKETVQIRNLIKEQAKEQAKVQAKERVKEQAKERAKERVAQVQARHQGSMLQSLHLESMREKVSRLLMAVQAQEDRLAQEAFHQRLQVRKEIILRCIVNMNRQPRMHFSVLICLLICKIKFSNILIQYSRINDSA